LLGGCVFTPRLATQEAFDLEEMIEVVPGLHSDELDDRLPPSLVVNTIGRIPLLPRHGAKKCQITFP
jgi:hypothetical protein